MTSVSLSSSALPSSVNAGLLVLRVAVGLVFAAHGWQKFATYGFAGTAGAFAQIGMPLPAVSSALVILLELLGGLALMAGLATRPLAVLLAVTMLVATVVVHGAAGFFLPNGYEFSLTLMLASITLALTGAGAYSVDGRLGR